MKALLDTSVLVAGLLSAHPSRDFHNRALPLLERARSAKFEYFVSLHTVAELYRVLTGMSPPYTISPRDARQLLEDNIFTCASIIQLSIADYKHVINRQSELGIRSGAILDALIVQAAQKAKVDRLYTFNLKHFHRVWPEGARIIMEP